MIPILLTAWETHPRFKYHVLFSSRDVKEEADLTMWGSGFRFRCCKASPIFWDQKSNFMYITNCASKTTYVSIVVSTVQENSSQSRSFKISSYLSLDFVGKPALRYIYLTSNFTNTTTSLHISRISSDLAPKVCTLLLLTRLQSCS